MKRLFSIAFLAFLLLSDLNSQGIYLRAGGGYGLPIATTSLGEKNIRNEVYDGQDYTTKTSRTNVKGSFGSGTNFNFSLGYKFNENFIIDLSTQYLISNRIKTADNFTYTNSDPQNSYKYVDLNNSTNSAQGLFLNPSVIFSAGFGNAAPYGRFGLVVGSPKVKGSELSYYNGDGIDSVARKWEYSKGFSIGFQGAVGMNWKITDKLDFYTEVNYVGLTYYAGEYNLTQYVSSNGYESTDYLPQIYLIDKKTIFKMEFDPNSVNSDPSKARVALPEAKPFSSISVQAGVRIQIWNMKE